MKLHDSHVRLYYRNTFKASTYIGDLLRECFPKAYTIYAEENGSKYGKDIDLSKAVTWK